MAVGTGHQKLKKELSLFGVYAIATGTTLSAGFFLLPGLAAAEAGPAVVLCYLIAAALLVPAMFSIVELATAMPRAGGAYYFLDRSLGPLAGTIGGFGTWLALVLKSAFALVGMGAYLALYFPQAPFQIIAVGLALFFGALNLMGSKKTGTFQIVLVVVLLAILAWFIAHGTTAINFDNFSGFFDKGSASILSASGLVFISYVGVTNIASVSEEVKNPERNLPLGIFLALGTAVLVYALGVSVMIGVLGDKDLAGTYTPVADVAESFASKWGKALVTVAALLAFAAVANAGIMSASRYPMAMSRDHILPKFFSRIGKRGTPTISIIVTVLAILFFLFGPMVIIAEMGWLSIVFSAGLIIVGIAWFRYYARNRVAREGAIYHVFDRLGQRRFDDLDRELRGIMQEKGLREEDPFDELIVRSITMDAEVGSSFQEIAQRASLLLSKRLPCEAQTLLDGFMQGTRTGATPVTGGIALPHLRMPGIDSAQLILVRSESGIRISTGDVFGQVHSSELTHAIFFLVSPDEDPRQHLRILAELAGQVSKDSFIDDWLKASGEQQLKEILLRNDRFASIHVQANSKAAPMIGRPLRELNIPEGCLVAIIHRGGSTIVPRGGTVIQEQDRLTIIGSPSGISQVNELYHDDSASS